MQDEGHIVKGQLHSECNDETGCGEKYEIEGTGQTVELERDEAVIIPESFQDKCFGDSFCTRPSKYKMTGTIKQIASAINTLGGGADFESGAKVWKNGRKMSKPRLTARNSRRNPPKLQGGSVVINRTNMLNPTVMTFEGTAYEIASKINSYGGNGVSLMRAGGELKSESKYVGEADFNVFAKDDKEAEEEARKLVSKIDPEADPELTHLYHKPYAREFTRKLFEQGGKIEWTEKELARIVDQAVKRQKEYLKLRKTESRKKNKNQLPIEIATMVSDPLDKKSLIPEQRKKLIEWSRDPENKVKFIVAFSGGKDSIAIVLHLIYKEFISPDQIELWHHEVDGMGENLWDWKCTTSYCKAFAKAVGCKLLFSYREGGITKEILKGLDGKLDISGDVYFQSEEGGEFHKSKSQGEPNKRLMFPAIETNLDKRWCSSLVKIDVMKRAINNMEKYSNASLIICTGERRGEGGNRSTYMEIEPYRFSFNANQITWRPVIDYSEQDVWDLMKEWNIQPHPAYEVGFGRCSCQLCIFNQRNQWATNNEISPEKVKRLAEIEKQIGSTLFNIDVKERKLIPAHEKRDKNNKVRKFKERYAMVSTGVKKDVYEAMVNDGKSFITSEIKAKWVAQATGEFTAPIIVPDGEWKLPIGAFSIETCGAS